MSATDTQFCPTLRPSRADFSRPFCEYVQDVCKKNPDIPMFKVVPPKGWKPRKDRFPQLDSLRIQTPIKQHVLGTGGAFRCFFEEQRALSVADFKRLSCSGSHKTPPKGHRQDELLERAFWSSVTINPPFYGADTPTSFFDEKLEYGWNLRSLEDLLTQYSVPPIAGVTTPMTYFGMWKSFFSWHLEDVDLYSINYLHFGAPKVWYCVSPKDRYKFEEMAKGLFPELHNICPAFLRHKDILLSPKTLRNHHINYVQAKQEGGEFIVLNAGAYHSGFNLGFNCAEAVNFATPDWLPAGRAASHCTCTALPDHVHLDMKLFSRGPRVSQRLKAALKKRQAEEDSGTDSESDDAETESSDAESESSAETAAPVAVKARRADPASKAAPRRVKQRPLNELSRVAQARVTQRTAEAGRATAAQQARPDGKAVVRNVAPAPSAAKRRTAGLATPSGPSVPSKVSVRAGGRSPAVAKLAAARGLGSKRLAGQPPEIVRETAPKRRRTAPETRAAPDLTEEGPGTGKVLRALEWVRTLVTGQQASEEVPSKSASQGEERATEQLCAVVGEDDATGEKYFFLVQRLGKKPQQAGCVAVRLLEQDSDGIYRPTTEVWEEAESALIRVRSQPWRKASQRADGYRLLTLRSRILDTELLD